MTDDVHDLLYLLDPDEPTTPPSPPKWLRPGSPRITLDDCVDASGAMQRMTPGEVHGKGGKSGGKSAVNGAVMGFGKYATSLIEDVRESDPSYLAWAIREDVKDIRARAEALGITEDDM